MTNNDTQYQIGEVVEYTNDYGVAWGRHEIVNTHTDHKGYTQYYIAPSTSPWSPVHGRNLTRSKDQSRIAPPELAKRLGELGQASIKQLVPIYERFRMYK